jgi:hypothetical protein
MVRQGAPFQFNGGVPGAKKNIGFKACGLKDTLDFLEIPFVKDILLGEYTQYVYEAFYLLRRLSGRQGFFQIVKLPDYRLHHVGVAPAAAAPEPRGKIKYRGKAAVYRFPGHGRKIVTYHGRRAASQDDVQFTVDYFNGVLDLFPQPGSAAKDDLFFQDFRGRYFGAEHAACGGTARLVRKVMLKDTA